MEERFIYVFNEYDKEKFLKAGFTLLKDCKQNSIFVFVGSESDVLKFEKNDSLAEYVVSDTIAL